MKDTKQSEEKHHHHLVISKEVNGEFITECRCGLKFPNTKVPEEMRTKQSETLEERVIEEFNKRFGSQDGDGYMFPNENGHYLSENSADSIKDFILKSLQQAKLEYKEELLKKMPPLKERDYVMLSQRAGGFNEARESIIKIINEL